MLNKKLLLICYDGIKLCYYFTTGYSYQQQSPGAPCYPDISQVSHVCTLYHATQSHPCRNYSGSQYKPRPPLPVSVPCYLAVSAWPPLCWTRHSSHTSWVLGSWTLWVPSTNHSLWLAAGLLGHNLGNYTSCLLSRCRECLPS